MLTVIKLLLIVSFIVFAVYNQYTRYDSSKEYLNSVVTELSVVDPETFKSVDFFVGDKSLTVDKSRVYVCLEDDDGSYYDRNMINYVILHELAHVLCKDCGENDHSDPKYKAIFKNLLDSAEEKGLYNSKLPLNKKYCHIQSSRT